MKGMNIFTHIQGCLDAAKIEGGGENNPPLGTPIFTFILLYYYSLSRNDKILLIFTNSVLFTSGILLGILCELLLKAISAGKLELYTYYV
jgi:hypothetical protein